MSDQNKNDVELLGHLNDTQVINNKQDEILVSIKIEEISDKERGD